MEWVMSWVAERLGPFGLVVYLVLLVSQHLSKADREAVIEMARGLWAIVANVPRRWRSERSRLKTKIAVLRASGLDDAAAVKATSVTLKSLVRVVTGFQEDVLCRLIDLGVVLVPFVAQIVKAVMKRRKAA